MGDQCNPRSQLSLDDLLADPLIQMIMRADKVDPEQIRRLYQTVRSSRIARAVARTAQEGDMAIYPVQAADYRAGVGIMLLNAHNEVFVGQRIGAAGEAWQMPQGGIDDDEEPLSAALRELREEIGTDDVEVMAESRGWLRYDLPDDLVGKVWDGRWRGQQQKWFAMRFRGADTDIKIATEHPEFSAWRWVSASHLPELIVLFKRQLYRDVLEQFQDVRTTVAL